MKNLLSVFAAAAVFALSYLLFSGPDELQEGEIVRTGSMEISNSTSYQYDVPYQARFSSLPELKIELIKGSAYLEVVEQRVDGFIFKTSNLGYSEAEGAYVEWSATGFIDK